eukprot:jgi/Mesvir1/16938/Mv25089-RA.2
MAITGGNLEALTDGSRTFGQDNNDPCAGDGWFGVRSCLAKFGGDLYVAELDFSQFEGVVLTGTLPASLGSLYFLQYLTITDQALTGTLPERLPRFLESCHLQGNDISGTIPPTFTSLLQSILVMNLGSNKLSGTVPSTFLADQNTQPGDFSFIQEELPEINLENNRLSGSIPPIIVSLSGPFTRVDRVLLGNNRFSGTLPNSWPSFIKKWPLFVEGADPYTPEMTVTSVFDASKNKLSGTIPLQLFMNSPYEIIELSDNSLSGTIPPEPFAVIAPPFPYVVRFAANGNSLSGYLPGQPRSLPSTSLASFEVGGNDISGYLLQSLLDSNGYLDKIDVSDNKLSGTLFTFTDRYSVTYLEYLDVSDNNLSGTFPIVGSVITDDDMAYGGPIFPGVRMLHFDAGNNDLEGTLPADWFNHAILFFNVSHNYLSGSLPSFERSLDGPTHLYLDHNLFTGAPIGSKPSLPAARSLYLDHNFAGAAAQGISSSLPSTVVVFAANDNFLTSMPDIGSGSLEELYLQNNQITGTISDSLACSPYLKALNLRNNSLTGTLPYELSISVEFLDVAYNSISGSFSPIYGLGYLSEVYVTSNQITGNVPLQPSSLTGTIVCSAFYSGSEPRWEYLRIGHFDLNNMGNFLIDFILTSAPVLEDLRLSYNLIDTSLNQFVPDVNPRPLRILDLHGMSMWDDLPSWLWAWFPSLQELRLGENFFSGSIPPELPTNLRSLIVLELGMNLLTGTLPPELGLLTSLQYLDVSTSYIEGTLPPQLAYLPSLAELYINNSPISGCIPAEFYRPGLTLNTVGSSTTGQCVGDAVPPLLTCPPPATLDIDPSFPGIDCDPTGLYAPYQTSCPPVVVAFLSPPVTDNSGRVSLSFTPTSFAKDVTATVAWTAVDEIGNVATCSSQLRPVSLPELIAIEVTQSVQDWAHTVPLVASKATMVRVFVQMQDDDVREAPLLLNGFLRGVRADGTLLGIIAKVNLESSLRITKKIRAGRGFIRGSFNFLLPEAWVSAGELTVCFLPDASDDFPSITPLHCREQDNVADCCLTVSFREVHKPCFRFIKVQYRDETNTIRFVTSFTLQEQWRRFRSMLPIPANSIAEFRQFDFVYASRPPLRVVNNALDATRIIDNLSQRCWYIGVLRGMGGGLAEFDGETAAYYAGASEGSYSCGYERNRGVHEFLHNMGIEHARQGDFTACSTVPNNEGPEFPYLEDVAIDDSGPVIRATLGPMSEIDTLVWGTDPQLAATGAPSVLAFMSPRFVFALMSYCQPLNFFGCQARWIDRDTYTRALTIIDERAPTGPQPLGADTPADITMFRGSIEISNGNFDVTLGPLLQVCTTADSLDKTNGKPSDFSLQVIEENTVHSNTKLIDTSTTADLIECTDANDPNCAVDGGSTVFGDFSRDPDVVETGCGFCFGSFDAFPTFSFDLLPQFSFDAFPSFSFDLLPQFSFDGYPCFSFDGAAYLLFDGFPTFSFDGLPKGTKTTPQGDFVVADFLGFFEEITGGYSDFDGVTQGISGTGVQTIDFKVVKNKTALGLPQGNTPLPNPIMLQFTFDLEQTVIATFNLSANPPVIGTIAKTPSGDVTTETTVTLCADISDPDADAVQLTTTIQYCPDYDGTLCNCEIFTLDHVDTATTANTVPRTACLEYEKKKLKASSSAVFRVYVSDGLRTVDGFSANFSVSNNVPEVEISFPVNGTFSYFGTNNLYLHGFGYDVEDGVLKQDCLWTEASDPNNLITLGGYGPEITVVSSLLRGGANLDSCETEHKLRLTCVDSVGNEGFAEVTHTLIGSSTPPTITCPGPLIEETADPSTCTAIVGYPNVTAQESCRSNAITPQLIAPTWATIGAAFPAGDTVVVYRATDPRSQSYASCQFTVRVGEVEPPTLTCPNITVPGVTSLGGAHVYFTVNATDNCQVAAAGALNPFESSGSLFPFGSTLVEYYADDPVGNRGTCAFTVDVTALLTCGAECTGTQGTYILEFTLELTTVGNPALDAEEACLWNIVFGTVVGLQDPGDPCVISSTDIARRRRDLLQGATILRVTRLFFPTEAQAVQAQELILQALEDGTLLAQLQALFGVTGIASINFLLNFLSGFTSDPHFQGPCGQRFDFMGAPGESFCLMTSEALHINGKMMAAVAPASRAGVAVTPVGSNNTWVQELGIRYGNASISISALSPPGAGFKAQSGRVFVNGVELGTTLAGRVMAVNGDVKVDRRKTRVKLTLGRAATLEVEIVRASFWEPGKGPGANFLNLKVLRLAPSVEWHGVLGQTFGMPCTTSASTNNGDPPKETPASQTSSAITLNVDSYRTSSLLASDCAVSRFKGPA